MLQALVGAAIRRAAKETLKEGAEAFLKRTARRAAALERAGIVTKDIEKLRSVQQTVKDKGGLKNLTRNELVSVYAKAVKLDKSPGTRARTASDVFAREQKAERRRELVRALDTPAKASRMSDSDLREAFSYQRKLLRDRARHVEKSVGETHATRKFHEALEEFGSARGKTRNQMLQITNKLSRISGYEGMTAEGARRQMERGEKWFGKEWKNFTPEEQGAIWDEINKYQAAHQVRSDVAVFTYREIMDKANGSGIVRPLFDRDPNTGKIRGVDFGITLDDAEAVQIKRKVNERVKKRITERSQKSPVKLW